MNLNRLTGIWRIAQPLYESAEGLGAGAPAAEPAAPVESDSLSDHEAAFSPGAHADEPAAAEPAADDRRADGTFKPRHRAASQRASADDVPRIAELTKNWRTAETERDTHRTRAESAERRIAELEARPPAQTPEPQQVKTPAPSQADPNDPKPAEADFDDYGDFIDARAKWSYRQIKREEQAEAAAQADTDRQNAIKAEFHTKFNAWVGRRQAFVTANPARASAFTAYVETLSAGTPIGDTILDSDVGAELADYLASHPDDADRIGKLSPVSQIRALGRIEATFDPVAPPRAPRVAAAPVLAPRPPNPVRTGPSRSDTDVPGEDATLAEHERAFGQRRR